MNPTVSTPWTNFPSNNSIQLPLIHPNSVLVQDTVWIIDGDHGLFQYALNAPVKYWQQLFKKTNSGRVQQGKLTPHAQTMQLPLFSQATDF